MKTIDILIRAAYPLIYIKPVKKCKSLSDKDLHQSKSQHHLLKVWYSIH